MSASDLYDEAEDLFKDENYLGASKLYDAAIAAAPTNARYLTNRANNSIKLKRYQDALADTTRALELEPTNGRAHFRRAISLFYLDEFSSSLDSFKESIKNQHVDKSMDQWIRKCEAELERIAKGPTVPVTSTSTTSTIIHKVEALPPPAAPSSSSSSSSTPAAPAAAAAPVKVPTNLAERTREQWFQTNDEVTVTLLAKNLKSEDVNVKFDESTNELKVTLAFPQDSSRFEKEWKLFGQSQAAPSVNITPYKVEILLKKVAGSSTWDALERKPGTAVADVVHRENVLSESINYAAYPTSAKTNKNWKEIEESAKKAEEEEKPEGEAALQKLFQQIYGNADEDTRRAMVKSFQTSGGTVLSTNWGEVKEKDYEKERTAPKGQEIKDWNSKDRGAV